MSLFVMGDLHLGLGENKPMDIFGTKWNNHYLKIKYDWLNKVNENDTVIIAGDISWAMKEEEAEIDLNFIKELPGKKVFIKGNHDLWWNTTSRLNEKYGPNMYFMKNTSIVYNDIAIAGTRGWICPNNIDYTEHDLKIYKREQQRLKLSLEDALKKDCKEIIVIMHYPPTNNKHEVSGFIDIINSYNIKKVIYAHLHGEASHNAGIKGMHDGVEYILASSDYLNFNLLKINQ